MRYSSFFIITVCGLLSASCGMSQKSKNKYPDPPVVSNKTVYPMQLTDAQWKQRLTADQYYILRQAGTEPAGTGKYDHFYEKGTYYSAASLQPLFSSDTKFNSGTGWPSFYAPIDEQNIRQIEDLSHGMRRIEVECAHCGAHLGHVFPDGPNPTGLRYCMNSASLDFKKDS